MSPKSWSEPAPPSPAAPWPVHASEASAPPEAATSARFNADLRADLVGTKMRAAASATTRTRQAAPIGVSDIIAVMLERVTSKTATPDMDADMMTILAADNSKAEMASTASVRFDSANVCEAVDGV